MMMQLRACSSATCMEVPLWVTKALQTSGFISKSGVTAARLSWYRSNHSEVQCCLPIKKLRPGLLSELIRSAGEEGAAVAPRCYCADHWLLATPALHRQLPELSI